MGMLPVAGATGGLVARSHASMAAMLGDSMAQVRGSFHETADAVFSVAELVADAARAAGYDAASRGCPFNVGEVDPFLGVSGHRAKILASLANILQNALKFTHPRTAVGLETRADTPASAALARTWQRSQCQCATDLEAPLFNSRPGEPAAALMTSPGEPCPCLAAREQRDTDNLFVADYCDLGRSTVLRSVDRGRRSARLPARVPSFGPRFAPRGWHAGRVGSPCLGPRILFAADIRQHHEVPLCSGLGVNVCTDIPFGLVRRAQFQEA